MKILLRLRSWQIFCLIAVPIFLPLGGYAIRTINLFGWVMYSGWIYAIGRVMHKLIPDKLKPNIVYFKICAVLVIFIGGTLLWPIPLFNNIYFNNSFSWSFLVCYLGCFFYIVAFSARMLESMIEGEVVGYREAFKGILMIFIIPVGIWHIQPAIHRVLNKYNQE